MLRTLDELVETVRDGLVRDVLGWSTEEALIALGQLRSRAERQDASCEICHAAAVEAGRAEGRAEAS